MRFTFDAGCRLLGLALALWEGVCLILRRREGPGGKRELRNPRFLGGFFLLCGALFLAIAWVAKAQGVFFSVISMLILYAALVATNQRLIWDEQGFWYRTTLGREVRYDYADVKGMGVLGSGVGLDLWVRAGGRLFLLDSTTGWTAFSAAYSKWQAQSGVPDWGAAREAARRARYARMGPFRRNLSQVPGGMALLVFTAVGGAFVSIVSVVALFSGIRHWWQAVMGVAMLAFGLYAGLAFPYAVAHMEDKPHLIRRLVHMPPSPGADRKRKAYRKKR